MKRANYLDLNKLPVPGGWEKAGWYYAHPIPGNTIPNDDKELAREQGMVAVGLARQLRGSPGYNPSNPLIEFFPNN
jgi:hypothetical protein